jgi:hypothetical protein
MKSASAASSVVRITRRVCMIGSKGWATIQVRSLGEATYLLGRVIFRSRT